MYDTACVMGRGVSTPALDWPRRSLNSGGIRYYYSFCPTLSAKDRFQQELMDTTKSPCAAVNSSDVSSRRNG